MSRKILILGASYGSLLGTKLLMAGHDVTLVCRKATAELFNAEGSEVRIKLRDEDLHRSIRSGDLPGALDAMERRNAPDHPTLMLRARLLADPQGPGCKRFTRTHLEHVQNLRLKASGFYTDVDTPESYAAIAETDRGVTA